MGDRDGKARVLALWLGACAAAGAAGASGLGDEAALFAEIPSVQSVSKYDQKVTEAPASVSVVTAAEIERYGYRTLAEVLRSLRGFYTSYDRNYVYAGVRGYGIPGDYNSRLLLLVDGIRVNDAVYDSAFFDTTFPVDLDLIERVEFVRGPGSSVYGTSALLGVVNVITKRGRDYGGLEVSGQTGSFSTYGARATGGARLASGLELLASGTLYRSDGDDDLYYPEFDDPSTNGGHAEDSDEDKAYQLFAKASLGDFTLEAFYSERDKEIPTAPWGTRFDDDGTQATDGEMRWDLKYDRVLGDLSRIAARATHGTYWYDGTYVYDAEDPADPPDRNEDDTDGRWWGAEAQYVRTWFESHTVIVGTEARWNQDQDQKNWWQGDAEPALDSDEDSWILALFAQDEWRIRENVRLVLGVRYDHYSTFGSTVNPRLALVYSPFAATTLKLLYGTAFRAPSAYELHYDDGGATQKAPDDLDPETIRTWEAVWEQALGEHWRASLSGFYFQLDDLIALGEDPNDLNADGDPLLAFGNRPEGVESRGVEAELEGRWANGLEGRVSYTYEEAEDEGTGSRPPNSPRHLAKLNLTAPLFTDLLLGGIEVQYTGERKTPKPDERVDGFWLANLTLFHSGWIEGLEVSASVYNLFDEEYDDPGSAEHEQAGIEQDGRTWRVKASYLF